MRDDLLRFLKGFAMGAANVIPGVSGGTIAFITGIYERLIDAVKGCDLTAARLLLRFQLREFCERIDARFLIAIGVGVAASILSLAKVFEIGFLHYPNLVWAFFFGLIAASLPAVGKLVKRWSAGPLLAVVLGCGGAASLAFLSPASENTNPLYLMLCGVVAMSSMIIPGLSGSFVLLLMGNYKLIMIDSVTALSDLRFGESLRVLIPVGMGAVLGLVVLARLLSWLFHHWHDLAVALITGFVAGSLLVIWPWKDVVPVRNDEGLILVKTAERAVEAREGAYEEVRRMALEADAEVLERGYTNWHLPDFSLGSTWAALGALAVGAVLILLLEGVSGARSRNKEAGSPSPAPKTE